MQLAQSGSPARAVASYASIYPYVYMFRYTYNGYIHHCSSVLPPDHHTVHHCPVGGVWGVSLKED